MVSATLGAQDVGLLAELGEHGSILHHASIEIGKTSSEIGSKIGRILLHRPGQSVTLLRNEGLYLVSELSDVLYGLRHRSAGGSQGMARAPLGRASATTLRTGRRRWHISHRRRTSATRAWGVCSSGDCVTTRKGTTLLILKTPLDGTDLVRDPRGRRSGRFDVTNRDWASRARRRRAESRGATEGNARVSEHCVRSNQS